MELEDKITELEVICNAKPGSGYFFEGVFHYESEQPKELTLNTKISKIGCQT